jgi:hypothetical protein
VTVDPNSDSRQPEQRRRYTINFSRGRFDFQSVESVAKPEPAKTKQRKGRRR